MANEILVIMAAVAIYKKQGLTNALQYLEMNGYTYDVAVECMATYDKLEEAAQTGMLLERRWSLN